MAPSGIRWRMGAKGLAYYNEIDRDAANWLRELIAEGLIAPGIVDDRSIEDVRPTDLLGFTQCHFFAGIGGWSYALRLAGWPDDRPAWTGSCPCQPFSQAGKGEGFADERHLWPAFDWLIEQCRPPTVFGEQVAGKPGLAWLDLVQADLEAKGYAVGSADLCAAGVGAPHIRQRLYWVANAGSSRSQEQRGEWSQSKGFTEDSSTVGLANSPGGGCGIERGQVVAREVRHADGSIGASGGVADSCSERRQQDAGSSLAHENPHGRARRVGGKPDGHHQPASDEQVYRHDAPGPADGFWRSADRLFCRDGKWRPVESGTFPLASGLPARVGRLRGYGNAIVPQVAVAFVRAYLGVIGG